MLVNLKQLVLSDATAVTAAGLKELAVLTKLNQFGFGGNALTDDDLRDRRHQEADRARPRPGRSRR